MAKTETAEMAKTVEKTEKIFIRRPAGTKEKAKIFGFNGKMYAIPYEKETEVPLGVAEIFRSFEKNCRFAEKDKERLIGQKKMNV